MPKSHGWKPCKENDLSHVVDQLVQEFAETLGVSWTVPADLRRGTSAAVNGCGGLSTLEPLAKRRRRLLAQVNWKFRLNKDRFQDFLDGAAKHRVFLNYHDKSELLDCFDQNDWPRFRRWHSERRLNPDL